jgi:hypothetical protein
MWPNSRHLGQVPTNAGDYYADQHKRYLDRGEMRGLQGYAIPSVFEGRA